LRAYPKLGHADHKAAKTAMSQLAAFIEEKKQSLKKKRQPKTYFVSY